MTPNWTDWAIVLTNGAGLDEETDEVVLIDEVL
jgi:hypothetical protein